MAMPSYPSPIDSHRHQWGLGAMFSRCSLDSQILMWNELRTLHLLLVVITGLYPQKMKVIDHPKWEYTANGVHVPNQAWHTHTTKTHKNYTQSGLTQYQGRSDSDTQVQHTPYENKGSQSTHRQWSVHTNRGDKYTNDKCGQVCCLRNTYMHRKHNLLIAQGKFGLNSMV